MFDQETLYWYKFTFEKNYDGDTVDGWLDLGFQVQWKLRFRLYGINAPEKQTTTLVAGKAAQVFLQALLEPASKAGKLMAHTYRDQADKYGGRWLAELYAPVSYNAAGEVGSAKFDLAGTWTNLNQLMINTGHAVPYIP